MKEEKEFNFKPYITVAIIMFMIISGSYLLNFYQYPISKNLSDWGTLGDFIGGTLNPILAFLSFMALLYTIKLQSKELKASREELELTRKELLRSADAQKEQSDSIKLQNFENTFFNMINLHNNIVNNMQLKEEVISFNNKINLKTNNNYNKGNKVFSKLFLILIKYQEKDNWNNYSLNYSNFYENHRNILTQYYKNIYQIFLFICENTKEDKQKRYINIFKAQFTTDELNLIITHLISGYTTGRYLEFVEKYSFFDSIIYNQKLFMMPIEYLSNDAFGQNNLIISKLNNKRKIK